MSWMQTAPLGILGLCFFVLLGAGVELGSRGPGWLRRGRPPPDFDQGAPHYLLTAVLGLLALLLGFTFSMALNRYQVGRDLVVQEANAIEVVWRRMQLLEEPTRTELSGLLRAYVDDRLAWSEAKSLTAQRKTAALEDRIWAVTGAAVRTDSLPQLAMAVMTSVNSAFDVAAARVADRREHVPSRVFSILLLYATLAMVMLGYITGHSRQPHRVATTILLVLLSLALIVILDLDRPRSGGIEVSQKPLEDLRAAIAVTPGWPPARP